jgi:sugar (pentulose or hexulose) kinase
MMFPKSNKPAETAEVIRECASRTHILANCVVVATTFDQQSVSA